MFSGIIKHTGKINRIYKNNNNCVIEILSKINSIRTQIKGSLPNIYLLHGEMTDEEMNLLNNDPKVKSFLSRTLKNQLRLHVLSMFLEKRIIMKE